MDKNINNKKKLIKYIQSNNLIEIKKIIKDNSIFLNSLAMRNQLLKEAININSLEIVDFLTESKKDINYNESEALYTAIMRGHVNIAKLLISKGANINEIEIDNLLHCASDGHFEMLKFIKTQGIDIITTDNFQTIRTATTNNHLEIIKYLVENGSNIYAENKHSMSAFDLALTNGHLEIMKYFIIDCNANVEKVINTVTNYNKSQEIINWAKEFKVLRDLNQKLTSELSKDAVDSIKKQKI